MIGKHSMRNIGQRMAGGCAAVLWSISGVRCAGLVLWLIVCKPVFAATNADDFISLPPPTETARGLYNAGTVRLRSGKLTDAELLLEASVSKQDESVQPVALFNLGHVRFAQGREELKKSPGDGAITGRSQAADKAGADAIQAGQAALASNDIQQMVAAYIAGRGVRKEMQSAIQAVQRAMEIYGKTLLKWRRSLADFRSVAELNPADTNATQNAEVVAQAIAKLVDSIKEMQQAAAGLGGKQLELSGLLKQLKGKIPAPDAPPGAAGDDEGEGDDGTLPLPESLSGLQESTSGGGNEMDMRVSSQEAGQLLNGIQPGGKQLPMGQGETGQPKNRSGRIW